MSDLRSSLQAIYDQHGKLTPALVVDAARPDGHPLHDRFEWDDSVAGPLHRITQAKALIRSVRIRYAEDNTGPRDVRAFVSIQPVDSVRSTYQPLEVTIADDFQRTLLMRQMEREWRMFRTRWEWMAEFIELIQREPPGGEGAA